MILAVDANNLIHRAYHAIPPMQGPNGTPSGALRGYLNTVLNLQEQTGASQVICAFDGGIPIIRKKAVPSYKANRPPKPEDLSVQLELACQTLTPAMGWTSLRTTNTEADDILYTMCLRARETNQTIAIASGDKDVAQCLEVDPKRSILLRPPKTSSDPWTELKAHQIESELLGVTPQQVADLLAIMGDSSDNLPGINGAGPVTVTKWMKTYGSLEGILQNIQNLEPKRFREKMDSELLNRNLLITKSYDTGHTLPTSAPEKSPNLEDLLREFGLYRLIKRATGVQPPKEPKTSQVDFQF